MPKQEASAGGTPYLGIITNLSTILLIKTSSKILTAVLEISISKPMRH